MCIDCLFDDTAPRYVRALALAAQMNVGRTVIQMNRAPLSVLCACSKACLHRVSRPQNGGGCTGEAAGRAVRCAERYHMESAGGSLKGSEVIHKLRTNGCKSQSSFPAVCAAHLRTIRRNAKRLGAPPVRQFRVDGRSVLVCDDVSRMHYVINS
jgi:hypothetical protein